MLVLVDHAAGELSGVSGRSGRVLIAVEHLVDVVEVGAALSLGAAPFLVPVFGASRA